MIKAAIMSDIHANLMLLDKALDLCNNLSVQHHIVLGDLISDGPDPQGVLDRLSSLTPHVIRGNREEYILQYINGQRPEWNNNLQCETLVRTSNSLSKEGIKYISELPNKKEIEIEGVKLLMLHGSHNKAGQLILPHRDIDEFMDIYDSYESNIILLGHSHRSYYLNIRDKTFINPGPLGIPHAYGRYPSKGLFCMGLLSINENGQIADYEQIPIEYDPKSLAEYYLKDRREYNNTFWLELIVDSFYKGHYKHIEFLDMASDIAKQKGLHNIDPLPNDIWLEAEKKWKKEHVMRAL